MTQIQGVGRADVFLCFDCPKTMQMRCPENGYCDLEKVSLLKIQKKYLLEIWKMIEVHHLPFYIFFSSVFCRHFLILR